MLILGIILTILAVLLFMLGFGSYIARNKTRAKKVFKIFKEVQSHFPQGKEQDLLMPTAMAYFKWLRWRDPQIIRAVHSIFQRDSGNDPKNVKELAHSILLFELFEDHNNTFNFELRETEKIPKAIEEAYKEVFMSLPRS